jgi:membrane-associated HD superfamily phosphohydrolase
MFWVNLKIAAAWCRQHWRWLVLSIAFVVVYMLGRRGSKSLKLQAELARKQYLREKEAIQKAHDHEIKKKEEAQKRYSDAVTEIEDRYEKHKENLTHARKEAIKQMVKKVKEDPAEVDRILEEELGIKKQ